MAEHPVHRDANAERILQFSPDRSLGSLLVRPRDAEVETRFDRLAVARWAVLVPPGMHVRLWADRETTGADLEVLEDFAPDALQELVLMSCKIGDTGAGHLAGLTGLRLLDLFRTQVTDRTLEVVAGMRDLEWLSFTGTAVTDRGAERLADLQHLARLSLKDTLVTDATATALADLPRLTWLSLTGTRVGDAGLRSLSRIATLEVLSVHRTDVTVDGMAWWWSERPDVELIAH